MLLWSVVDLLCVRYTAKWLNTIQKNLKRLYIYIYIYIYIFRLFQWFFPMIDYYVVLFSVLYSRSCFLFIYFIYSNVHQLISKPWFIPPLLSPLVTISFFSMSVSLFLRKKFYYKKFTVEKKRIYIHVFITGSPCCTVGKK